MKLTQKALEVLQKFITGEDGPDYRSGPVLVSLFNEFGFDDRYGQGFPSRWMYVKERLDTINGTPELKRLIESVYSPEGFVEREELLKSCVEKFNKYLAFSDLQLRLSGKRASVGSLSGVIVNAESINVLSDEFIENQLVKIDEKLFKGDYDGAISSCRSLAEAILNAIYLSAKGAELPKSGDLKQDYKAIREVLALGPEGKDDSIKQLLNALTSLVDGIDALSNRMGDRHRRKYKPLRRHAKLVVNSTKTFVDFVVDTYLDQCSNS